MALVPSTRNARVLLAAALCLLGIAHLLYHAPYTLDDAYITFRYSRNLVRGLGLVYNPGDYVKGYSNTLYTLLMAVPELLGRDPIVFSKLLGVASFCAICVLGYRLYAEDPAAEVRDRGVWFVALCAISTPLAVHCMNGLETGSFAALVLAAVLARLREQRTAGAPWSALLFCAVVWSRPEGIALFLAMALHDAALRLQARKLSARDVLFFVAPLIAYAGELGLCQLYYGDPFPQTYYAKVKPADELAGALEALWHGIVKQARAESYLAKGLDFIGGLFALLLLPLSLLPPARRRVNAALLLVLLAQLVFIVRSGVDWAPAFRFGIPALPLLLLLVLETLAALAMFAAPRSRLVFSALAALLVAFALPLNVSQSRVIDTQRYVDAAHKLVEGAKLAQLAEPGTTLASFDIGGQGYAAGGFDILDTAGLTVRGLTRCFEQKTRRCKRYVALVRPELIRRQPSGKDAALTSEPAQASGLYMDLDEGRYSILRALVLLPRLPEYATPSVAGDAEVQLAGVDLPPVVNAAKPAVLTLFWKRAGAAALPARQLRWQRDGAAPTAASASAPLWSRAPDAAGLWTSELLFADRVTIRAPAQPGRYTLWARVQGADVRGGAIEVVDQTAAKARARTLAQEAAALSKAGQTVAALVRFERALQLGADAAARDAYRALAVTRARSLADDAEADTGNRAAALARVRDAKALLHRAFWQSARADSQLRSAIDENAAQFAALILADLSRLPARPRH